ncbi:sodium:solute symporter family transporter [Filifactor alocis]|uniref:sodium:solute symporter family transporter n=1 Tax=Filifactor alocis TaxID=143361 RepID=UPI003FA0F896
MIGNYLALGVYLLVLAILTFIASKNESKADFLVASRNVGWKSLAISIFASIISSYNIVVGLSFSYFFGPWVALVYMGALMGFVVIYHLVKNDDTAKLINGHFSSIVDFLMDKFGRINASVFNLSFILVLFIFISIQFFVNTTIFSAIMGWDKYTSTLAVGIIVFLYIVKGGLKVEILTDVFQGLLMLLFIGLLFFIDTSKLTSETVIPLLEDKTLMISALCLGISQFLTLLVQPDMWQRIYASKSNVDLKKSIVLSTVLVFVFVIPIIIIGLSVRAGGGVENPDTLFYDILKNSAPDWFLPFISVALFAAFMSSLDSALFALGTQIGKYGIWIKKNTILKTEGEEQTVRNVKISLLFITISTLTASLFFANFLSHVLQLISLLTVNAVVVLLGILLKLSNREVLVSLLVGMVLFFFAIFENIISDQPYTVLYPSMAVTLYVFIQQFIIKVMKKLKQ